MSQRLEIERLAPDGHDAVLALERYLHTRIDRRLLEFVKLRARSSTAARSVSTCIPRGCCKPVRTSGGSLPWLFGRSLPSSATQSVPRWPSPTLSHASTKAASQTRSGVQRSTRTVESDRRPPVCYRDDQRMEPAVGRSAQGTASSGALTRATAGRLTRAGARPPWQPWMRRRCSLPWHRR